MLNATQTRRAAYKPKPKDVQVIQLDIKVIGCYREHKFPDGDPRQVCHFGLSAIDTTRCAHCSFFHDVPGLASRKLVTGPDIIRLSRFLQTMKEEKHPDAVKPEFYQRVKNRLNAVLKKWGRK